MSNQQDCDEIREEGRGDKKLSPRVPRRINNAYLEKKSENSCVDLKCKSYIHSNINVAAILRGMNISMPDNPVHIT